MAVVVRRSGLPGRLGRCHRRASHRWVRAVLQSLAERLPDGWIDLLAAELPGRAGLMLRSARPTGHAAGLVAAVARRAALTPARADDVVDAVFMAVVLACDARLLQRVTDGLDSDVRIAFGSARQRAARDYRLGPRSRFCAPSISNTTLGMP